MITLIKVQSHLNWGLFKQRLVNVFSTVFQIKSVQSRKNVRMLIVVMIGQTVFEVLSFEVKNRVFEFDYQKMNMFESVKCSKK